MSATLQVIQSVESASALLNPVRIRILEQLAEPRSAAAIARALDIPRQHVNYHLHELESAGLAEFVEERRRGNCMERVMRASAQAYLIGTRALGQLGATPGMFRGRLSMAYLVSLAARVIGDLATLAERAAAAGKRVATLGMESEIRFANARDRNAFASELTAAVAQLAAKYHDAETPGGRTFRLVVGVLPVITKPGTPALSSVRME